MTARSASTELQRADEMRARILANVEAWIVLRRPVRREYNPAEFTIIDDDRRLPLGARDPRALELEYAERRIDFWNEKHAHLVRFAARRAVRIARHLARRALDPERDRVAA